MNQRLLQLYQEIERGNSQKFIDNQIEPDAMWGKSIEGTTLQIDLSEEVRDAMSNIQSQLSLLEPESLLLSPREFMHISFNQVVYWGVKYKLGQTRTWQKVSEDFLTNFKQLDAIFTSFSITFSRLIATTSGIIWCAFDEEDQMEKLRQELHNRLPFPEETTKVNNFIHTTVVRFKKQLANPSRVLEFIRNQSLNVSMNVEEIILRKECRYPSLDTQEIARIKLKITHG